MTTATVLTWQEAEAQQRFQLIAPLLQKDLDSATKTQIRQQVADANQISSRSIYRYEKAFAEFGFRGLYPMNRETRRSQKLPNNFDELLQEAIQLKREVPGRSVETIIYILENEGRVPPGYLKRSTLERHLFNAGYGQKQMKIYKEARSSSSKRFCKEHRMELIQGDIKYGPKLPIGPNGSLKRTYLSSALDDHSRYILASRFYDNQEEAIVEDTFHTVITRFVKFDSCYFDNGSQYIAKQLKLSLQKLGIRIKHAPPRSGRSKGKIEKFHQVVDSFLAEAKVHNVKTLEELNRLWQIYLEEKYEKTPHDGIKEYYESLNVEIPEAGITPEQEFNRDARALVYLDTSVVAEAFMKHAERRVDKGACISLGGRLYETKPELIGYTVEISYDPMNMDVITVSHPMMEPFEAKPVRINSYCDQKKTLPISMQQPIPKSSRLMDVLEKKHAENLAKRTDAISFAALKKEDSGNV